MDSPGEAAQGDGPVIWLLPYSVAMLLVGGACVFYPSEVRERLFPNWRELHRYRWDSMSILTFRAVGVVGILMGTITMLTYLFGSP